MKHSTAAVLLRMLAVGMLLLLTSPPYGQPQGESVLYVKPQCPEGNSVCKTLSDYANQSFHSSTTLKFHSGNHTLNRNFTVMDIANLTLSGPSANRTRVTCTAPVAFLFEDISHVIISGLTILSCGSNYSGYVPESYEYCDKVYFAALLIVSVEHFELSNSVLQNNRNGTLSAYSSNVTLTNNVMSHNGGGVRAHESNVTFTYNVFDNNKAQIWSAVFATKTSLLFQGGNVFQNNTAHKGGAILADNSIVTFSERISFASNNAELGGAIWASNSNVYFSGNSTLSNNSAAEGGGAIWALDSNVIFTGNNNFSNNGVTFGGNASHTNNSAAEGGGAILASGCNVIFTGNNNFTNNSAKRGGAILAAASNLTFSGNNGIITSTVSKGGRMWVAESDLTYTGKSNFINNGAEYEGGAIWSLGSRITLSGNSSFTNNSAEFGSGGAVWTRSSSVTFSGNNTLISNRAGNGGGIYISGSSLTFTGENYIAKNMAVFDGGGIWAVEAIITFRENSSCSFLDNMANDKGAGISAHLSSITFAGNVIFKENSASKAAGGGVFLQYSDIIFTGNSRFEKNSAASYGGGLAAVSSTVMLLFPGESNFIDNEAKKAGGGISTYFSDLYFLTGNTTFRNNSAGNGGGLSLVGTLYLSPGYTKVYFINNSAKNKGGAVYVKDINPLAYCNGEINTDCFIQVLELKTVNFDTTLFFENNTAIEGGNSLYGGAVDFCRLRVQNITYALFSDLINITEADISSDPLHLCFCQCKTDNSSACAGWRNIPPEIYPGETFNVSLLALGQRNGPVSALIRSAFSKSVNAEFSGGTEIQHLNASCGNLSYTIILREMEFSKRQKLLVTVMLFTDGPCVNDDLSVTLELTILPCPPGFDLSESSGKCACDKRLQSYAVNCNIENRTLEHHGMFWVGFTKSGGLILHPHCPFDYCKPETDIVYFTPHSTDEQCDYDRSGLLCGACKSGQSLVLGNSHCHRCTNKTLALLILFAMGGFALVILLLTCKLTVAAGTINGLIFYANIIAPNRAIFFPQGDVNILTVLLAWLNLDIGIETCFYDGMDAYAKMWLQFVFPVYIWAIIAIIILASNCSQKIAKLMGSNPVAVLATLFLLSYAKLLHTMIATFSFVTLEYPTHNERVWLYDGNVPYLCDKHIALFSAGLLLLVFLFLPYTLLLVTYQWLQAKSHMKVFSWINNAKLTFFLDAYHAPYKPKQRYWTGLLLLVRLPMLLTFGLNYQRDPSVNLLAISAACLGLATLVWVNGDVAYNKLYLNALEGSFILNLGLLAAATYHIQLSGGNQAVATYVSVSVAFATFILILMYHLYLQLKDTRVGRIMKVKFDKVKSMAVFCKPNDDMLNEEQETVQEKLSDSSFAPTSNYVELRESLLQEN